MCDVVFALSPLRGREHSPRPPLTPLHVMPTTSLEVERLSVACGQRTCKIYLGVVL